MQNMHVARDICAYNQPCARCARSRARELHGKFKFYKGKREFFHLLPLPPPPLTFVLHRLVCTVLRGAIFRSILSRASIVLHTQCLLH